RPAAIGSSGSRLTLRLGRLARDGLRRSTPRRIAFTSRSTVGPLLLRRSHRRCDRLVRPAHRRRTASASRIARRRSVDQRQFVRPQAR
ncbi:MAG TPA: hypothetical protein DCQ98_18205, partial [Planctomycetaceae bacterium]|nr:hypothetical protein [Planctomycetaceae bacterium]